MKISGWFNLRKKERKVSEGFLDMVGEKELLKENANLLRKAEKDLLDFIKKSVPETMHRTFYKEQLYSRAINIQELAEEQQQHLGEISRLEKIQNK